MLVFQQALNRLDAAMVAAGEPRSTVGGTRRDSATGAIVTDSGRPMSGGVAVAGGDGDAGVLGSSNGRMLSSSPAGAAAASGAMVAVAQQCSRLMFEMFYITDELLHYALKHEGFVGEFALRLANLVYSVVFRHEVRGIGLVPFGFVLFCFVSCCVVCVVGMGEFPRLEGGVR